MNLPLIDPSVLALDCPDRLTGELRSGHSTCVRFSRRGDLLASGRLDGTVVIFDIETNGVARKLAGHTRHVQSLSWSSDGRHLLSSSHDWKCVLWDLKDGSRLHTVRFEAPIFIAELDPTSHLHFIAAIFEEQPQLIDLTTKIPARSTLPSAPRRLQLDTDAGHEKQAAQDAKQTTTVSIFSTSGNHILAGTNKGWLNIIDRKTCQVVHSYRLTNNIIIFLRLGSSGRDLVVNASDRMIRTLHLPDLDDSTLDVDNIRLEVQHKFQDTISRLAWNYCSFSSTGEYVTASSSQNHELRVWETRDRGSLITILEGPEELSVVEWHPRRPIIAAVGTDSGRVYIWSIVTPQRWSALAPDFVEVEENVEYVEREDEFDIQPIEETHKRRLELEDDDVDVLTYGPLKPEFEEGEFKMPVLLDIDDTDSEDEVVEVGTGQFRRKSPGRGKEWMNDEEVPSGDETRRAVNGGRGHNGAKRRRAE